jgi:uncharacterized membrane protein YhhN
MQAAAILPRVTATVVLLVIAGVLAVGDWLAVRQRLFHLEYLLKPATLAVLTAAAGVADLGEIKPWVVAALALGLLGDVGLMLSDGNTDPPFLAGLGSFLFGHVCYVIAFVSAGLHGLASIAGLLVVGGIAGLALPAVLRGAVRSAGPVFAGIVGTYAAVLAAMAVLGVGTGIVATAAGAVSFLCSDTLIARDRFVAHIPHGKVLIIVTYHVGQFLILIGLVYGR